MVRVNAPSAAWDSAGLVWAASECYGLCVQHSAAFSVVQSRVARQHVQGGKKTVAVRPYITEDTGTILGHISRHIRGQKDRQKGSKKVNDAARSSRCKSL